MSQIAQILSKAATLGVRFRLDGEVLKMEGPRDARDAIRGAVIAHKAEIVACLRDAALVAGSPYSMAEVSAMRAELADLCRRAAEHLHWPDEDRAWAAEYATRCPAADLATDLAWYRRQVAELDAERHARQVIAAARGAAGTRPRGKPFFPNLHQGA